MISLKVKGKTLEILQGSHVYFASDDGIAFFKEWEDIEGDELKNILSKLEKMGEAVMDKFSIAASEAKKPNTKQLIIN